MKVDVQEALAYIESARDDRGHFGGDIGQVTLDLALDSVMESKDFGELVNRLREALAHAERVKAQIEHELEICNRLKLGLKP